MRGDIAWFIRTCRLCQLRQTRNVLIPPVVANPAPLFAKVYTDTMHLPKSNSCKYIVQGRCSLTHFVEFCALRVENAVTLGEWLFQDILCRWRTISEIVTDNGPAFVKALDYLKKKYHIMHIRISGYNSRANGIVERSHFDVQQALFKAVDRVQSQWSKAVFAIFWADHITIRHHMGCSPYFTATGTHPILPLDIAEATYLLPPPTSTLSTTDLIASRAIALRKSHLSALHSKVAARVQAAVRFEREYSVTVQDFDFGHGDLVLVRNTAIEKALNRKMRARYLGPLVVVSRNKGGAYIICELNGSVFDRPVAAFRVVPYFALKSIALSDLSGFLDISATRLRDMEDSASLGDDDPKVFDMPLGPDAVSDSSSVPGDDEDDDDSD